MQGSWTSIFQSRRLASSNQSNTSEEEGSPEPQVNIDSDHEAISEEDEAMSKILSLPFSMRENPLPPMMP